MPQTFGTANAPSPRSLHAHSTAPAPRRCRRSFAREAYRGSLEVLAGGNALDLAAAACVLALVHQRPDEDDPLALLARYLRPVVGVGGVGEVLVLLELLAY